LAYTGRTESGEWGLALSSAAQGSLIDIVGASFFPLYKVVGPMTFFLSLMLLVWGAFRLMVTILIRIIVIVRCKGCGIWVMTALWGTLFQLAISPFSWVDAAMEGVGKRVGQMMESETDREPEDERPKRKALSMEDLRRKYSWWPSGSGKELCKASRALNCSSIVINDDDIAKGECKRAYGLGSQCRPNERLFRVWETPGGRDFG
jgi:hypothetical protein